MDPPAFDVNREVFQPFENQLKKDFWVECRDLIADTLLNNFKKNVEFARSLHAISKSVRPAVAHVKPSQMAHDFCKIEKLIQAVLGDPIQCTARICELFITLQGEFLLVDDMFEKFFNLLDTWVGLLYKCVSTSCTVDCACKARFFDQAIAVGRADYNELCKAERPGRALFEACFGTIIMRASMMLEKLDQSIPPYSLIDKHNSQGLRKLLMDSELGFQITCTQTGHLWLHVMHDDDRCHAKAFRQNILPTSGDTPAVNF